MAAQKPDVITDDGAVFILRAGTKLYVKTAVICAMTGKSNQWIGQLVSQGALHKHRTRHGALFDATEAMHAYCERLEARAAPAVSDDAAAQEAAKNAAETQLKVAKATIAQLEAQELQGKMHRSEDVSALTADLIYTIRGGLMALPGRVATDVAAAETAAEAAEIIRQEVFKVMSELAGYRYDPEKYAERVRRRQDWEPDGECAVDDG